MIVSLRIAAVSQVSSGSPIALSAGSLGPSGTLRHRRRGRLRRRWRRYHFRSRTRCPSPRGPPRRPRSPSPPKPPSWPHCASFIIGGGRGLRRLQSVPWVASVPWVLCRHPTASTATRPTPRQQSRLQIQEESFHVHVVMSPLSDKLCRVDQIHNLRVLHDSTFGGWLSQAFLSFFCDC